MCTRNSWISRESRHYTARRGGVKVLSLLGVMLALASPAHAATYTAALSGAWNINTTWTPNGLPVTGDTVIIPAGKTVSLLGGGSGRAACVMLTGGALTFTDVGSLRT